MYLDHFVWNRFLAEPLKTLHLERLTPFYLPIIHGSFEQLRASHGLALLLHLILIGMDVYGSSIELTLVSKRSSHFAGTRYLKRGINEEGHPILLSVLLCY